MAGGKFISHMRKQVKRVNNMLCEFEIKERLINDYRRFRRLPKIAEKEGAAETLKEIDEEIRFIKLKLQPLELPED